MSENVAMEANEHREHAEHAHHDAFLRLVSITIAILAVASAAVSSLESNESAAAIASSGEAILHQDKATDQWAFYQAKGIKSEIYTVASDAGGPKAADYKKQTERYKGEQTEIRAKAEEEEKHAKEATEAQELHEHRHHLLGFGETISHVAIAIATIAIITRQRWPWLASIGLGVAAGAMTALAYF